MCNPARAEGVRPSSRANRRIWSAQPRVTRSSGFAIRSPARAADEGRRPRQQRGCLAVPHDRLAVAGQGVGIDRGDHARGHLPDRPSPDGLGGRIEVGRRPGRGPPRQRLPVIEPGGARFAMQSFERAWHRCGTAPPHQLAPPATRVASRLAGCSPGFAHGRPRWPRPRAGRPTGPPPPAPHPRSRSDRNGETRPRAHNWEARMSTSAGPACGSPRSTLLAFTRRAPLAEFLVR